MVKLPRVSALENRWELDPRDSRRGSCHPCQLRIRHVKVFLDERGYDESASLQKARHGDAHRRRHDK